MHVYIVTEDYSNGVDSWTTVSEIFSSRDEAEEYARHLNEQYDLTNTEWNNTCFYIQPWVVKEPS